MTRTLYLHIGTEKTGTTSIQKALYLNQKRLRQSGFHFIQSAGSENNVALPAALVEYDATSSFLKTLGIHSAEQHQSFAQKTVERFHNELEKLSPETHSVIISSEHFHSQASSPEAISRLKAVLDGRFDKVKIICYVREQSATCVSLYSTAIKMGFSPNFTSFLKTCKPDNPYYNYHTFLSRWSKEFGRENVRVRVFGSESFLNGDLIDDFFSCIDATLINDISKEFESENESLNIFGLFMGRAANIALKQAPEHGSAWKDTLNLIYQEFRGKGPSLSNAQYQKVYDDFVDCNTALNLDYFGNDSPLFPYKAPKTGAAGIELEDYLESTAAFIKGLVTTSSPGNDVAQTDDIDTTELDADLLRDVAQHLERHDLVLARTLMALAAKARPKGPTIAAKLHEYDQLLTGKAESAEQE